MRRVLVGLVLGALLSGAALAQFSFYLIDNFEDGDHTESPKWWSFGDLKAEVTRNPSFSSSAFHRGSSCKGTNRGSMFHLEGPQDRGGSMSSSHRQLMFGLQVTCVQFGFHPFDARSFTLDLHLERVDDFTGDLCQ